MGFTPQEKEIRSKGIGSSEIGAIMGKSKWDDKYSIWAKKVHGIQSEENDAMRRGTFLEPIVARLYYDLTGNVMDYPGTIVHPEHEYVVDSVDGIATTHVGNRLSVEIKTASKYTSGYGEPGTDQIPDQYLLQCIWHCGAHNTDICDVPVFFMTDALEAMVSGAIEGTLDIHDVRSHILVNCHPLLKIYRVEHDEELYAEMVAQAQKFWKDHVLTREPPQKGCTRGTIEAIKKLNPTCSDKSKKQQMDDFDALDRYFDIEDEIAKLEEIKNGLKAEIMDQIGDGYSIETPRGKATWSETGGRSVVNYKKIVELLEPGQEIIDQHTKKSKPTRVLRIKSKSK